MTLRRRLARLATAHPCPTCGGTGRADVTTPPAARGHGLTSTEVMADATAKMLDLARQYAADGDTGTSPP